MPRRKAVQAEMPDLPALVLVPTCKFHRPDRDWRTRRRNDGYIPDSAQVELLEAIASLLAMIVLIESFLGASEKESPAATWLNQLQRALEDLEDAIMGEWLDSPANADTSELAAIEELFDSLPQIRTKSSGQKAFAFFMNEAHRRAIEVFHFAIGAVGSSDSIQSFRIVDQIRYPIR